MAHHAGITQVTLVRGAVGGDPHLPCIEVLDNTDQFNMVHSLFRAEQRFGDDFIMSYADILYEPVVLGAVLAAQTDVAVAIDMDWTAYYRFRSADPGTIAESLRLDGDRILEIGQPLHASQPLPEGQYIGLARFRGSGVSALAETYHELSGRYRGKPWRNAARFELAFMTDLLQELIDRGVDVRAVPINRGWIEFDSKDDYEGVLAADASRELSQFIRLDSLPERPTVLSAGGPLWRASGGTLEVMIVEQGARGAWRLPKGMQEPGELITATASREVMEETGVCCRTGQYLGSSSWTYEYGLRDWDEIARFYMMEQSGGTCSIVDPQIISAEWIAVSGAIERLQYPDERKLVGLANNILALNL